MGSTLPHPPPMQAAVRGSQIEFSMHLPMDLLPAVLRDSGRVRGLRSMPWITAGSDRPYSAYVVWFKQPPERRGPLTEAWKVVAGDQRLDRCFAGVLDGGALGNIGIRIWGTKPADPGVVTYIASLLGAPAST